MKALSYTFVAFVLSLAASAETNLVGKTEAELIAIKGKPMSKMVANSQAIYRWADSEITLSNGKVVLVSRRDPEPTEQTTPREEVRLTTTRPDTFSRSNKGALELELSRLRKQLYNLSTQLQSATNADVRNLGRTSEAVQKADADYKAAWERDNPFSSSRLMPSTPQDRYEAAFMQAGTLKFQEAQRHETYLQQQITLLEQKLAEDEKSQAESELAKQLSAEEEIKSLKIKNAALEAANRELLKKSEESQAKGK